MVKMAVFAPILLVLRHGSDRALRGPAGVLGRHTGCDVLVDELFLMEMKFGFELDVGIRTAEQRPQAQTDDV